MLATGTFNPPFHASTSFRPLCKAANNAALVTISVYCESGSTYLNFVNKALSMLNSSFNLLKPTSYVIHCQFNIQQLYVLPTLYLCVLYLSENRQRLVPLIA